MQRGTIKVVSLAKDDGVSNDGMIESQKSLNRITIYRAKVTPEETGLTVNLNL